MAIHQDFDESVDLARTYAEDGAFNSAARVLRQLAERLEAHSSKCNDELTKAIEAPRCPACGRDPDDPRLVGCSECGDFRPGAAASAARAAEAR